MGNRSSSTVITNTSESTIESGDSVESGPASGIFLGEKLQGKIIHDFQNIRLSEEWLEHQKRILEIGKQRVAQEEAARAKIRKELEAFQEKNKARQFELDTEIDELHARFRDAEIIIRHDVSRTEKDIHQGKLPKVNALNATFLLWLFATNQIFELLQLGESDSCLKVRIDLTDCLRQRDISQCYDDIEGLERCMKKAINIVPAM